MPGPVVSYRQKLDQLLKELESHPVYDNGYFKILQGSNWTPEIFALHRANFFYRTELTVKSIAQVCARAAAENDMPTLTLFSYILNEETGNGDIRNCHGLLMETSHNLFGKTVFGLEPMAVTEAKNSPLIIEGTQDYRDRISELAGGSYQRLLGVAMALESHAEKMLTHCRTGFRNHVGDLDRNLFVRMVEVYFNVHLNGGVEERHASDARECVSQNCRSEKDFAEIAFGARETLDIQLAMWQDMHRHALVLTRSEIRANAGKSDKMAEHQQVRISS